jgi:hypothetical protein
MSQQLAADVGSLDRGLPARLVILPRCPQVPQQQENPQTTGVGPEARFAEA